MGAAAIAAGAVAAVSGFGIGSLLTPLLLLSMSTAHAVAIVAIPHAVATFIRWLRLRSDVHRPTFRQFGIASAAGGLAGAALQSRLGGPVLTAAALLVDAARVPVYVLSAGDAIAAAAPLWVSASIGVTIGTFLGVPMLGRIPPATYRRLLGGLLVLLGVALFVAAA